MKKNRNQWILGIDPGNIQSGWVLYTPQEHKIEYKGIDTNVELIAMLRNNSLVPDVVAIEMIASYGMPVGASVFDTCVWIGRFIECLYRLDIPTELIFRKTACNALCHSVRASDANVRQAIIDIFPPDGGGKTPQIGLKNKQGRLYGMSKDMWNALAIALTYSIENRLLVPKIYKTV